MDNTVDVMIPVDAEAAKALESPARREAVGRYLSSLLKGGRARDVLAEAIMAAPVNGHDFRPGTGIDTDHFGHDCLRKGQGTETEQLA